MERSECNILVSKIFGSNAELKSFFIEKGNDSLGLIGSSKRLNISIWNNGSTENIRLYIKTLPENQFLSKLVKETRCFHKEAEFYNTIVPKLKLNLKTKIFPVCYFANDKKVVLEDLSLQCYKTATGTFGIHHCKSALLSLANLHSSSFLYETKYGLFSNNFPELMFVSWYSDIKNHPGHKHMMTGARCLEILIEKYFPNVSLEIKNKCVALINSTADMIKPSKIHKNAISHCDLWCNNVMFNDSSKACLIDFQLFNYNPPALDVLMLIYLNIEKANREKRINYLLKFYYDALYTYTYTKDEFKNSFFEVLPAVLTQTALFLHYVLLPEQFLSPIVSDEKNLEKFMHDSRDKVVLQAMEENAYYKFRILSSLSDIIEYIENKDFVCNNLIQF